ncbi:caspase family protein [Variovorax sp. J22R115]|uniref:caspase family protein n=1 Tax=Variovorax sp. J22R115 TaxID=3053509 RepID=UPI002576468A|nr:caspase family protein [Variovorax sp. J22R115]
MRSLAFIVALGTLIGAWTDALAADVQPRDRRIALVVGNSNYPAVPLPNPQNDAHLIAANLRKLGFEVNEQINLAVLPFRRALREFARRAQQAGVTSVFYYAGHGVQIDGRNYLLPVDLNLRDQEEVKDESIDIEELFLSRLDRAGGAAGVRIVILDACRDNPFAGRTRSIATAGGLAEMGARGALIAYASAPGAPAEDGPTGKNSVYTRALAQEMMVPGLEVEQMFKTVRMRVLRDTNGRQVPWVNTSLTSDFSFNPARSAPTVAERALQDRVKLLESQLARERQLLAAAHQQPALPAATAQEPRLAREKPSGPVAKAAAATAPPPAAVERIDRLQSDLASTRQKLVSSKAPPPPAIQSAAKKALASSAEMRPTERRFMGKAELEQMFVGKNQTFIQLITGSTFRWYVRGDGNVFYKDQKSGKMGRGAWKFEDDGRLCVQWDAPRVTTSDNCNYYFSESGKLLRTRSMDLGARANAQILEIQ